MRKWIAAAATAVALGSTAYAQSAAPDACARVTAEIEDGQKLLAASAVSGAAETSAIREGARSGQDTAEIARIQANMNTLAALHCQPYAHPISSKRYLKSALACGNASIFNKKACDMNNWTPED